MRGAEAILRRSRILGRSVVVKSRLAKTYRERKLDEKLRRERTRSEARLLHKAKLAGVDCPTVLEVDDFGITMSFVQGKRPEMTKKESEEAGAILAKLHESDIIHGDYTPANLIKNKNLSVIDFGLGFVSKDVEDKATDVFTMLRAIEEKEAFMKGYRRYAKSHAVFERVKGIEKRVRYAF